MRGGVLFFSKDWRKDLTTFKHNTLDTDIYKVSSIFFSNTDLKL